LARPSSSSRLFPSWTVFLVLPWLLTSCLDLNVAVDFRTSTAGQVRIDALTWRGAQGLQFVDGNDRISFPATRAEWQVLVDQVAALSRTGAPLPTTPTGAVAASGLSIVSWAGAEEDLGFRSSTVLAFTNARALEGLFAVFKQKLTLLQDNAGQWTITFVPQVPRVTGANLETRRLWTTLWGQTSWSFGFTPPGQPRSDRSVTLADLAGAQPPAEWTLSW